MSVLTDLEAALAKRTAEYAALAAEPTRSVGGASFQHDSHRLALIKEIQELNLLIIQVRGTQITRTQVLT